MVSESHQVSVSVQSSEFRVQSSEFKIQQWGRDESRPYCCKKCQSSGLTFLTFFNFFIRKGSVNFAEN